MHPHDLYITFKRNCTIERQALHNLALGGKIGVVKPSTHPLGVAIEAVNELVADARFGELGDKLFFLLVQLRKDLLGLFLGVSQNPRAAPIVAASSNQV
jgi:hypothetical protein